MKNNLTLGWIISTLKESGINSKQIVIDRLENATVEELINLMNNIEEIYLDIPKWARKTNKK